MIGSDSPLEFGDQPLVFGRTPLLPTSYAIRLLESDDIERDLRQILCERPQVLLAIQISSASLGRAASLWLKGGRFENDRIFLRIMAYVLRMSMRPTPFGLCATVGLVDTSRDPTPLRLSEGGRRFTRGRVDMGWLMKAVRELERDEQVVKAAKLFTNDHVLIRGERLFLTHPDAIRSEGGQEVALDFESISLRYTAEVAAVMASAQNGATFKELVEAVSVICSVDLPEIEKFVLQLCSAGLLISSFRPSPLEQPCAQVVRNSIGIESPFLEYVRDLHDELSDLDRRELLDRSVEDYQRIHTEAIRRIPAKNAYQVDAGHEFSGSLPRPILDDVSRLAWLQLRSNPKITIESYKKRFLERYGSSEYCVPLLELVDSQFGIGAPPNPEPNADTELSQRQALSELVIRGLREADFELSLTEDELEKCLGRDPSPQDVPDSIDIGFEIVATDANDIPAGNYRIVPSTVAITPEGGSCIGRFSQMLGDTVLKRVQELHRVSDDGAIHAELVYLPAGDRAANVCIRPNARRYQIDFGSQLVTGPDTQRISLRDLVISMRDNHFVIWSLSLGREVRVHEGHLLNRTQGIPPAYLLLSAIAQDGKVRCAPFSWGSLRYFPALPRIRIDRLVLCTAHWNVRREELGATRADLPSAVKRWRARANVPKTVLLNSYDHRLPINLDSEHGMDLLYDNVRRRKTELMVFSEIYPSLEDVWVTDGRHKYRTEFIATATIRKPQTRSSFRDADSVSHQSRQLVPLSDWCYIKVYCGDRRTDAVISRLAGAANSLIQSGEAKGWFYLRYSDPFSHVRFRVRLGTQDMTVSAIRTLSQTCEVLIAEGAVSSFAFDTYVREFERYGGPRCYDAIEAIFYEDSRLCAEAVTELGNDYDRRVTLAMELLDYVLFRPLGAEFVLRYLSGVGRPKERLTREAWQSVNTFQDLLSDCWRSWVPAPCAMTELKEYESKGLISRTLLEIANSLIHMHCNRMGIVGQDERVFLGLLWHTYNGLSKRALLKA